MRNKLFSLFIALCCSLLSLTYASDIQIDGIWYYFNDENMTATVTYQGTAMFDYQKYTDRYKGDVVIPPSVEYNDQTYAVKAIGMDAFDSCKELTSVTVPSSVESIGQQAFCLCSNLSSVNLSNGLLSIGYMAFYECTSLTSIVLPESVQTLESSAFSRCTNLISINIPSGVTKLSSNLFSMCPGLISITIPSTITSIDSEAFDKCDGLGAVYISDLEAWCKIEFNGSWSNPLYFAHKLYLNNELVTDLVIPDGITRIDDSAFYNATCLTSVTIPPSVTKIEQYAFSGCENLNAVYISDLTAWCNITMYSYPLYTAHNLYLNGELIKDLVIPDEATNVANFNYATCIESVTIPENVTTFGSSAFLDCFNLTSVTWNAKNATLSSTSSPFQNCSKLTSFMVGDKVESIPEKLLYGYQVGINIQSSLILPETLKSIGAYAFYECSKIDSLYMPNTVTSLGTYAFYNCSGLKYATISNQLTDIGQYTFYGCSSLEGIVIPASIATIGQNAFNGCKKFKYITCEAVEPPACGASAFESVNKSIPLYVPAESIEAYRKADQWMDFTDIRPMEAEEVTEPIKEIETQPQDNSVIITWPIVEDADTYVLEITKDGKLICTLTFSADGRLMGIAFAVARNNNHHAPAAVQTGNGGLRFTVSGLESGTTYNMDVIAKDVMNHTIKTYQAEFTTTGTTSIDQIDSSSHQGGDRSRLILHNGQIFILRDHQTYTLTGQEIR